MLAEFAKLIGVRRDIAEDALHSERAARHVLSRRGMLGTMAAMAVGTVVSLPALPRRINPDCMTAFYNGWQLGNMLVLGHLGALYAYAWDPRSGFAGEEE